MYKLTLTLICLLAFITTHGQEGLTLRDAFNLHPGDSLCYNFTFTTNCEPYPGHFTTCTYDQGLNGIKVDTRTDFTDSLVFTVHSGDTSGSLIVTNLDSGINHFYGLKGTFVHTPSGNFLSDSAADDQDVPFVSCDSFSIGCSIDSSNWAPNHGKMLRQQVEYFESGGDKTILEWCGLFEKEYDCMFCGQGTIGGHSVKLVYYHVGSTVWLDTAYFFNGVKNISPQSAAFTLYPNPVHNQLLIGNCNPGDEVDIADVLGRTWLVHKTTSSATTVNVSALPMGMYWVILKNGSNPAGVKKLVKD